MDPDGKSFKTDPSKRSRGRLVAPELRPQLLQEEAVRFQRGEHKVPVRLQVLREVGEAHGAMRDAPQQLHPLGPQVLLQVTLVFKKVQRVWVSFGF